MMAWGVKVYMVFCLCGFPLLASCRSGPFDQSRCYNCINDNRLSAAESVKAFAAHYQSQYATVEENGDENEDSFSFSICNIAFKSRKPVRVDESGSWFHRFSLSVLTFKNSAEAARYLNWFVDEYHKGDPEIRDKYWGPCYYLITGNLVYRLRQEWFYAGWIDDIFASLAGILFPDGDMEQDSVLTTRIVAGKEYFRLDELE